ncbi:MAG TPA: hypothetical protein PK474_09115, partial [Agitococcus sp.]|nr:hypothetical protein [Agitococcus sp.]
EHARPHQGEMGREGAAKRQNFSETSTRTLANGETVKRETTQTVTDNGFTRNSTLTNGAGQTATKNLTVVNDKETGTHTRTMSGTTFDGKSYSNTSTSQKTEDGFNRSHSFTTPDGKTGSKQVTGVVDKEAGTVTKTTTINTPNGESKQHSVTHQLNPQTSAN